MGGGGGGGGGPRTCGHGDIEVWEHRGEGGWEHGVLEIWIWICACEHQYGYMYVHMLNMELLIALKTLYFQLQCIRDVSHKFCIYIYALMMCHTCALTYAQQI